MNQEIENIIDQLQTLQDGKPWIGRTFDKKLGEINKQQFFAQPLADLYSIAQIISHLTLWRREAILKINTGKGNKTSDCPENWPDNAALKELGWNKILDDYKKSTSQLIALLHDKTDSFLRQQYFDTDFKGHYTYSWLLNGIIQHDVYHLGQIGIIVKCLKTGKSA